MYHVSRTAPYAILFIVCITMWTATSIRFTLFLACSVDRNKYQIHIPLPPKIDPTVTMMQVEEKPDVTYSDVGGSKEQIDKLREVVETPLLHVSFDGVCNRYDVAFLGMCICVYTIYI